MVRALENHLLRLAIGVRLLLLRKDNDYDLQDVMNSRKEYVGILLRICEAAAFLEVLHSFIGIGYIKTHTVINIFITNWVTWGILPFFTKKDVRRIQCNNNNASTSLLTKFSC